MTEYAVKDAGIPVSLSPAEVRALLEAAAALDYNLPGLSSAQKKLKAVKA